MDLELKDFENKINHITEQFMSLLDSNDVLETPAEPNKEPGVNELTSNYQECVVKPFSFEKTSTFCLNPNEIKFDGISYGNQDKRVAKDFPMHAVKFDSVEQLELNQELEKLYQEKHAGSKCVFAENPTIAFSDSNLVGINRMGSAIQEEYARIQTDSTLKKEVYDMSNYEGQEKKENMFFSFATIPAEKALVEKKDWKDILFMDIPWDTKIDILGGLKSLCSVNVKFTF